MELPLPPRLGALVAKHRPRIPELLGALTQQPMLQGSPYHRCRTFRPQGAGAIATVLEAVHLLAYYIGALADATAEQIGRLQERRPYLPETRALEVLPRHGLHRLPALKYLWQ